MNTSFRLIFALTLIVLTSITANADQRAAMTAANAWLALVDAGEYQQSWLTANKTLKEQSEKNEWANYLKAIREPLGKVISRRVTRSRTVSQIQGMPNGEYFQVQFEVKFPTKSGMERMTVAKEGGSWKVAGYMFR
jgi:hypothetical protein